MLQKTKNQKHKTVFLNEAINWLNIKNERINGIYIDATFGQGGHSYKILERLGKRGRLIAIDKDIESVALGNKITDSRFSIIHNCFTKLDIILKKYNIQKIDGILFDLGISSNQINNALRGFSFLLDGPLDMRMDITCGISASKWLANATEFNIKKVIRDYGEERFATKIAKKIVHYRSITPITRTKQLVEIILKSTRNNKKYKNPATRTFQAIRIYINQELKNLLIALKMGFKKLNKKGRIVVISFHSLEDRIVKNFINLNIKIPYIDRRLPIYNYLFKPKMKFLARCKPSNLEIEKNFSARSAIMRVFEKISL
ncbi:16S rRNA (cytosine(1402)-N(4))-methyltransferase RsmH [Candidatus Profftella armatura (Diaphorina cf. continua)]|uniref:Ribosomal RNA small subunit methyltransferase H n=1 Tax=Candidatus Profftella armatura (Diaphorina cf. continua) TaxID=2661583 RepID=A0A7R6VYU6_9PROT|nr:16S rRNA (cytosine(1402)-N(4))-methyltransferase RsmH [Candidatus Profftella armatura (Diaphorina cf. continua)]BCG49574.1 16S rRNA (cytosine(1402)-N(4))-methyltransferase RsmH [Candidatus Profftella armatura (Diaphorina cf. continua)]